MKAVRASRKRAGRRVVPPVLPPAEPLPTPEKGSDGRLPPPSEAGTGSHQSVQSPPSPVLPPEAARLAQLLLRGVHAEDAITQLGVSRETALSWLASPQFPELMASPTTIAEHVRRTYAELVPQALATKEHLLRHGDDTIRDRVASEIIKVASGSELEDEKEVLRIDRPAYLLFVSILNELGIDPDAPTPSRVVDVTAESGAEPSSDVGD
ncbi:MAG: hypothetical protein D6812_01205 [Deltaproteobacteria bacterium]|nr:MAG: hypothetical protein D6812_01205 [Deltaproteobacteria bacterium]